jgi:hypothetical protein
LSDNVSITPGIGAPIAADNVGGNFHQRVKISVGADGVATDASETTPLPVAAYGELVEAMEAMRFAIAALTKSIGFALPNALGQPIMEVRQSTAGNLQVTTTLAGGQTLATLTNQAQIGGFAANDQIPALMHLQADNLRRNITVT